LRKICTLNRCHSGTSVLRSANYFLNSGGNEHNEHTQANDNNVSANHHLYPENEQHDAR
jgi:hypothetical protein